MEVNALNGIYASNAISKNNISFGAKKTPKRTDEKDFKQLGAALELLATYAKCDVSKAVIEKNIKELRAIASALPNTVSLEKNIPQKGPDTSVTKSYEGGVEHAKYYSGYRLDCDVVKTGDKTAYTNYFYENGKLKEKVSTVGDYKAGLATYYEDGKKKAISWFDKETGEVIKKSIFGPDDDLVYQSRVNNGKIECEWVKVQGDKHHCVTFNTDYNANQTTYSQKEYDMEGVKKQATVNANGRVNVKFFGNQGYLTKEEIYYEFARNANPRN